MENYRDYLKGGSYKRPVFFMVTTAAALLALYFGFKNLNYIYAVGTKWLFTFLDALTPLWIGLILAYMLDPIVASIDKRIMGRLVVRRKMEEAKKERRFALARTLSIVLTYLIVLAALVGILYGFMSLISGRLVFESIPKLFNSVVDMIAGFQRDIQQFMRNIPNDSLSEHTKDIASGFMKWLTGSFDSKVLIGKVTSLGSGTFNFIVGLIISIYVLLDKEFFLSCWHRYMPVFLKRETLSSLEDNLRDVDNILSQFIRGVMIDSMIIAVASSVGLSVIGVRFAVFLGIFAGVANVIPYFGPIMGMIPAFIIGTFNDSITKGLLAILILFIIQQIDGNIIYPKVVGSSTGLRPLVVIVAMSLFGYYWGILGMVIAVPLSSILQMFFLKWLHRKEALKKTKDGNEQKPEVSAETVKHINE